MFSVTENPIIGQKERYFDGRWPDRNERSANVRDGTLYGVQAHWLPEPNGFGAQSPGPLLAPFPSETDSVGLSGL
jgi:hypothetical protein